jgi:Uma2 family endonuclease
MTTPAPEKLYTPDDLLAMEDSAGYELLDGRLVERNVSETSSHVASILIGLLQPFVRAHRLGRVYNPDLGMQIFPGFPRRIRKADVSFVAAGRVPGHDQGFLQVVPDLVAEVVSPGDGAAEVRAKVDLWLGAGVKLVWVAYPAQREIHVYRAAGHASILGPADELSGEDVVPGFACAVADCFPEP